MSVRDVVRVRLGVDRVHITGCEPRVVDVRALGVRTRLLEHVGRRVDPVDPARSNARGDVDRDRARSTTDVENIATGTQI